MKQETLEERIQYIAFLHKQNLNGRETEDELFEAGILAGIEETKERMYSEEDMRNAFDSAREFNSLDGVVDVHIVLPMGGDMSDLQPLHFTFKDWFEQFKKK